MNRNIVFPAVFFIAVLIGALFFYSSKSAKDTGIFTFGAVLPLSGPAAESAEAQQFGIDLAREELQQVIPHIQILIRDSQLDPEIGKTQAQDLINSGADVLYSSFTYVTQKVTDVSLAHKIPLFYDSCNCGFAQTNPYAFQLYIDPRKECRVVGEHYKARGVKAAAYIGPDVPYGTYCYEALQSVFGESNVSIEIEQDGIRKKYTSLLPKLKSDGVGVILSIPIAQSITEIIEANASAKADIPISCFAGQCLTKKMSDSVPEEALKNVYAFDFKISDLFVTRIRTKNPDITPEEITAGAVAHDALIYAATGYLQCKNFDAHCIARVSANPVTQTAIVAYGFTPERILDYESQYREGGLTNTQ